MNRTGLSPFQDLRTLTALWRHFLVLKPDFILPYTMKPIIFGCIAARLAGVPHRFALITGLGYLFADTSPKPRLASLRQLAVMLYRSALVGVERVFVYNDADKADVRKYKMVSHKTPVILLPGSGVDLHHFRYSEPPSGPPVFLLIARLLRSKGIPEYIEAARELRKRFPDVRTQLLGPFDSHPIGITRAEIGNWVKEGTIEFLGETRDVRPYLSRCTVFVLPSCYREGIPRSILEAMATGRAIITTDAPGCRDTVIEGENGYLIPAGDSAKLLAAMEAFVTSPALAVHMGRRSFEIASRRFDVDVVNRLILKEMKIV